MGSKLHIADNLLVGLVGMGCDLRVSNTDFSGSLISGCGALQLESCLLSIGFIIFRK